LIVDFTAPHRGPPSNPHAGYVVGIAGWSLVKILVRPSAKMTQRHIARQ